MKYLRFSAKKRPFLLLFLPISLIIGLSILIGKPRVPVNLDTSAYFFNVYSFMKSEMLHYFFPTWNPHSLCGYPLLAMPQGLFLNLPAFLNIFINFNLALAIDASLKIFIYLSFMFVYLRMLGCSRFAAFTSAIMLLIATVGSYINIYSLNLVYLFPAAFYYSEKLLQKNKTGVSIVLGIVLAIAFLSGHPQYNFYLYLSLFSYALFRAVSINKGMPEKKIVLLFIISIVTAALLSAAGFFPICELVKASNRSAGLTWLESAQGTSIPPWQLIGFILPSAFGNYYNATEWGGKSYGTSLYIGILGLFFLVIALLNHRKSSYITTFSFIGIVSLLLALGRFLPFYYIFYTFIPGFKLFRGADRILYLFTFSASVIVAFGLDYFIKNLHQDKSLLPKVKRLFLIIIAAAAAFILLIAVLFKGIVLNAGKAMVFKFLVSQSGHPYDSSYYIEKLNSLYRFNVFGLVKLIFVALSAYLIIKIYSKKRNMIFLKISLFSVISLDLIFAQVTFGGQFPAILMGDKQVYDYTPRCIEWINKDSGNFRIMTLGGSVPANIGMRYGLYNIKGYDALYVSRFYNFWSKVVLRDTGKARDFSDVWRSLIGFDENEKLSDYNRRMLDLLGVKYILSPVEITDGSLKLAYLAEEPKYKKPLLLPNDASNLLLLKSMREGRSYYPDISVYNRRIYIYENNSVYPRVFLVDKYVKAINQNDAINKLSQPDFDLKRTAVLEGIDAADLPPQQAEGNAGTARILSYAPQSIEISVNTLKSCPLILTDVWYPGWKAYIDNKETKIYKADVVFRAVSVPAGSHRVKFIYTPVLFYIGLIISLLTLVMIIFFAAIRFIMNLKNR